MKLYALFVHQLLTSLYRESMIRGTDFYDVHEIIGRYHIEYYESWLDRFLEDSRAFGYAEVKREIAKVGRSASGQFVNRPYRILVKLDDSGRRYIDLYEESSIAVSLAKLSQDIQNRVDDHLKSLSEEMDAIDSRLWTGLSKPRDIAAEAVDEILADLKRLEREIEDSGLSNYEKSKAKALTKAMAELISSPEPQWKEMLSLIVTFLSSPAVASTLVLVDISAKIIARVLAG
jgi:hypothetical protein